MEQKALLPVSPEAEAIQEAARHLALQRKHQHVLVGHLIKVLCDDSRCNDYLQRLGIDPDKVRVESEKRLSMLPIHEEITSCSDSKTFIQALEMANTEAARLGSSAVYPEHLFLGLATVMTTVDGEFILAGSKVGVEKCRQALPQDLKPKAAPVAPSQAITASAAVTGAHVPVKTASVVPAPSKLPAAAGIPASAPAVKGVGAGAAAAPTQPSVVTINPLAKNFGAIATFPANGNVRVPYDKIAAEIKDPQARHNLRVHLARMQLSLAEVSAT